MNKPFIRAVRRELARRAHALRRDGTHPEKVQRQLALYVLTTVLPEGQRNAIVSHGSDTTAVAIDVITTLLWGRIGTDDAEDLLRGLANVGRLRDEAMSMLG